MIERPPARPPVTYTTFQARDLGGDTAELFKTAAREAYERFRPNAMMVGASCTAELIQDDPGGLAKALNLPVPVVALELPSYQRKENWGASEAFYQMVRALAGPRAPAAGAKRLPETPRTQGRRPCCNLLGPTALGFRHRDDLREVTALLDKIGVDVKVVAPLGAEARDLACLGEADFNVVLYPEIAALSAAWLSRTFGSPSPAQCRSARARRATSLRKCGPGRHRAGTGAREATSRSTWYARSVDSTYLTGKRVFIFGDATHAVAAAGSLRPSSGSPSSGLGHLQPRIRP
jgi:light-independent protochlorophyllide reductase subunit B